MNCQVLAAFSKHFKRVKKPEQKLKKPHQPSRAAQKRLTIQHLQTVCYSLLKPTRVQVWMQCSEKSKSLLANASRPKSFFPGVATAAKTTCGWPTAHEKQ